MTDSFGTTTLLGLIARLQAGDLSAWDDVYRHTGSRLEALAHRMLRTFPQVHGFEQTDDVLQNAVLRLLRALQVVRPGSVREFFGLAGEQLRRELLDLKRHYYGPQGLATYQAPPNGADPHSDPLATIPDRAPEWLELEEWSEFHRQIGELPMELREVVDLHFYQGLTKAESATVLGVDARTVQRRWNIALNRIRSLRREEGPSL
jgi:RNA polymerase sigma-70 factor (ECF subfamily)